jgi:hypothetical protein
MGIDSLSQEVKQVGYGIDQPLPSCTEVNERVDLYFYSSCGPSSTPPVGLHGLFKGELYLYH